jgi:ABC-2 type transport system permease protein
MKSFIAFIKKEFLDSIRSGRLLIISLLFMLFGIMNPAIAKITPWLLKTLGESLESNGMIITEVEVNALTSWTQFFKNIPMALIAFVLMFGNIFTKEYEKGTLVLILTKGISRYKVLLSKTIFLILLWTIGFFVCFLITYLYNDYFWDNSIVNNLMLTVFNWWLFGIFVISTLIIFSTITTTYGNVLLGLLASIVFCYILSLISKINLFIPTSLMNTSKLLLGLESSCLYIKTIIITSILSIILIISSIPIFNKKQL